ncbi:hypothetical protein POSPLADRAFT_1049946 [Postia placenta MAD-698-R-SB12]|uniref:Sodium/calcium exchanger membrane region domain-containing protein n=1 Tax=Postia placenta MAD-698-R-SB12 TaxID=670580 RepID=A0A1X6MND2_9APHY|nr:hypothetical protein POSPLADRAFT_1049946 [Postia placenta MAD-698-R-SB12]OSX57746.1 hypothetical protein POSPLADRAFT_1049946 [Postia placenta MAD-698-R-SB12]
MWSGSPKLLFVVVFALNCVLWSHSRYGQVYSVRSGTLARRGSHDIEYANTTLPLLLWNGEEGEEQCFPKSVPLEQQCAHVLEACPGTRTFLSIPYLRTYFCTETSLRPLIFGAYFMWLIFLFSTLGISASDFFCPNLATLAQSLGLDENMAGVTFLAFGNGSPDVFSTFSAMKANSGGLAIGELLGAATFVVSCVVGSLCIIKPFKVMRYRFFRDVGFFTLAVIVLLIVLWDNKMDTWEAASMIVLYAVYATVVIGGSIWEKRAERKRRYEELLRDEYRDEALSFLGKIAAVLAAPAVMALTLTLPVVVTAYHDSSREREKLHGGGSENRLIDFEEEGVERALIAEDEVEEEMHELKYNKWLMAVQCTLGPLFCVAILFVGMKHEWWLLLATGVAGFAVGIMVAVFSDQGKHPTAQLARCIMGFMVAVVWIMAIADEVVEVLQTFGFIFGLSDAIIGLTIFAVGNSTADLVANMSVAVFAPIMGFSACFGGPMLNLLLGVGISGSYITHKTAEPYYLHFTTTLMITGIGLLALLVATLIFVPLNGYFLPRSWGVALIIAYTAIMTANVIVEIKS